MSSDDRNDEVAKLKASLAAMKEDQKNALESVKEESKKARGRGRE